MINENPSQDANAAIGSPVAPYLVVDGGDRAIDFYRRAFGAIDIT